MANYDESQETTLQRIARILQCTEDDAKEAMIRYGLIQQKPPRKKAEVKVLRTHEYTKVHKTYHCVHCGFMWGATFSLAKGESTNTFGQSPNKASVHMATGQEEMYLDTYVSNCSNCKRFIQTLSRDELEDRYLALLSTCADAVKRIFTTEVPR